MIRYDPKKILKKIAPGSKIEAALSDSLTLKKAALTNASKFDFIDPKAIENIALKTIKGYRERIAAENATAEEIAADPAQLVQRVQNEVVFQVAQGIKENYSGEYYVWTPSDADEPDPEHQLNYGKTFKVGEGEMPGERIGCRCGMDILVDGSTLDL